MYLVCRILCIVYIEWDKEHYHCVKCDHDKRKEDMRTKPKHKQGICKQCDNDNRRPTSQIQQTTTTTTTTPSYIHS